MSTDPASPQGPRRPKLTAAAIATIWRLHRAWVTQRTIAVRLGVSQATVSHVLTGKTWRHLPAPSVPPLRDRDVWQRLLISKT